MITSKKIKNTLLLEPAENSEGYEEKLRRLSHNYIDKGWWVFICRPHGDINSEGKPANKEPHYLAPNGFKSATNDKDQFDKWIDKVPNANLAIACGQSKLAIIDIDPRNGGHFRENDDYFSVFSQNGKEYKLPKTRVVKTGGGGYHLYYSGALKLPAKLDDGIDFKSTGGYVIAPPSIHETGNTYQLVKDYPVVAFPIELINTTQNNETSPLIEGGNGFQYKDEVLEGSRNNELVRMTGHCTRTNKTLDETILLGISYNTRSFKPPLSENEVVNTIKDACQRYGENYFNSLFSTPIPDDESPKHAIDEYRDYSFYEYYSNSSGSSIGTHVVQNISHADNLNNNLTDLGNSNRLVKLHGRELRFCESENSWYIWNGKKWEKDDSNKILIYVEDVIKKLFDEALKANDSNDRTLLAQHAIRSESANSARNLVYWAKSKLPVKIEEFDTDNEFVNVNNGVINLRTGEMLQHDSRYLMRKILPFDYRPGEDCPKWLWFLEFTIKDKETIKWVQKALGLSLSGRTGKVLPILFGKKDGGKSTFSETILRLFGDYGHKTNLDAFSLSSPQSEGGDKPNSRLKDLKGARFVVANETKGNQKLDVAMIKDITGGDTLNARGIYAKEAQKFTPTHTLWIYGNHKPIIGGDEDDVWGRVCIVDFQGVFTPEIARPMDMVIGEFLEEASGILNWILEGYQLWLAEGIKKTITIEKSTNEYRDEEDIFKQFINEKCELGEGFRVSKDELIQRFSAYCFNYGEKKFTLTKAKVTRRLKEMGVEEFGKGRSMYTGIRMIEEEGLF